MCSNIYLIKNTPIPVVWELTEIHSDKVKSSFILQHF